MAYSTPRTWVAGEIVTAANLNTDVRDNIAWLATDSPCVRAYNSAAISTASSASLPGVAMTYNSERFDNCAFHSTVTNTSRLTVPTGGGGKYLVGSACLLGHTTFFTSITLNGAATTIGASAIGSTFGSTGSPTLVVYALSAADYAELYVFQNTGSNKDVSGQPGPGPELYALWFRT